MANEEPPSGSPERTGSEWLALALALLGLVLSLACAVYGPLLVLLRQASELEPTLPAYPTWTSFAADGLALFVCGVALVLSLWRGRTLKAAAALAAAGLLVTVAATCLQLAIGRAFGF